MASVFIRDSLSFHTFLLLLLPSLNYPILSEVHLADFHSLCFIARPGNSYFFELYFFSYKSPFFPINVWIEFSKLGIPQDDAILS
jgi:hypothetical protein